MLGGCPVCPESWAAEGGAGWVRGEEHGWHLGKGCSQGPSGSLLSLLQWNSNCMETHWAV